MRTFLIVLILMLGSLPAVASQHHHRYHHITTTYRHHSYRHYAYHHHYGACDGIHRCICGSTQARHFGLPRMYHGHNLWEAGEWGRAFPHTSAHPGAVVVKTHHVAQLVSASGGCSRAVVRDDRGEHPYNICGAQFVDVR
jgi:hypothetical protein